MKALLVIFSLAGGFFASNDDAVEFAKDNFNNMRNGIHERSEGKGGFSFTQEEADLKLYLEELKVEFDFENLTVEEKLAAMEEINELMLVKADELGVDITPMIERHLERVENYEKYNSVEWIAFREYMDQLKVDYDLENLTAEEKVAALDEIQVLMIAKADELGVDISEILERQLERADHFELMNSEEVIALREYHQELMAGYDFENLTEEEIFAAMDEIKVLVQAKADELGIDLSEIEKPERSGLHHGRRNSRGASFERGNKGQRRNAPENTNTNTETEEA